MVLETHTRGHGCCDEDTDVAATVFAACDSYSTMRQSGKRKRHGYERDHIIAISLHRTCTTNNVVET